MDNSRWVKIQEIFHTLSDLPVPLQREMLASKCGGDTELAGEVLALLEEDGQHSELLDGSLGQAAAEIFNEPATHSAYKNIGPYEIQGVLGEGGMGIVFYGVRPDLESPAAIKILRDAWISPARRRRFAREQRTLAQLNHPNIARLLDADTLGDGTPYFVMEYVDGRPLDVYCEANRCGIVERLKLFRSACQSVQFAHQHTVIHRDLKPSNILVTTDGTVKLLDFGIAKQLASLTPHPDQTRTGLRLLTPAYASPEQITGAALGIHTDVYSLGVILYQLLTGRVPFDVTDLTPTEAIMLVERQPVRPSLVAQRVREQLPGASYFPSASKSAWDDLDVLCLTAMHKDPDKRYASVEALIRDLDHYLAGEALEARPDTLSYRMSKFIRRHRAAVLASSGAAAAAFALVIFFTVKLTIERNAALAEAARTQRVQRFMLNLFQGGDKEAGPANDMRVATLIERGVQEARALDQDPEVQAELYQTLGGIYRKLGNLNNADSLLQAALDKRRSLGTASQPAVADSLVALGMLRVSQARLSEAEQLVRQGLRESRQNLPSGHPRIAAAMEALGKVLEEKGAYDEAIAVLQQAVQLRSDNNAAPVDLADSLYELANVHFYAGHYRQSEALNQQVLALYSQIYGRRHPRVADVLINLGAIQHDTGHYREAERFHRQALDINRAFHGENHYETASSMTLVARALVFQKRYDEADVLLRQALKVQETVFGKVHPRVASALNELGSIALMREQFDEAEADFRRMADIYQTIYQGNHYLAGVALSNLGAVYLAEKNNVEAERLFRRALVIYAQTLPPGHLNTAIARCKLGRTLLRQKRYSEAEIETFAGYKILKAQVSPPTSWLKSARGDLAEIYDCLRQPAKAAAFRVELAQAQMSK